jgi:hypothetical protein
MGQAILAKNAVAQGEAYSTGVPVPPVANVMKHFTAVNYEFF